MKIHFYTAAHKCKKFNGITTKLFFSKLVNDDSARKKEKICDFE